MTVASYNWLPPKKMFLHVANIQIGPRAAKSKHVALKTLYRKFNETLKASSNFPKG